MCCRIGDPNFDAAYKDALTRNSRKPVNGDQVAVGDVIPWPAATGIQGRNGGGIAMTYATASINPHYAARLRRASHSGRRSRTGRSTPACHEHRSPAARCRT